MQATVAVPVLYCSQKMRTIHELEANIRSEALIHGEKSAPVAKLKSLLGLAWIDDDFDKGISVSVSTSYKYL